MDEKSKQCSSSEPDWLGLRAKIMMDPNSINLNTGSYGHTPQSVFRVAEEIRSQIAHQPMDFLIRRLPQKLHHSRLTLANFLNCSFASVAFFPNVTLALNVVINSVSKIFGPQTDLAKVEILLSDLEYGSLVWAWERMARLTGLKLKWVRLPRRPNNSEEILKAFQNQRTAATRAIFFSHITSPTGMILPAKELCAWAKTHGMVSIVDGAHVPGFAPLDLKNVGADFYAANCHKWLLAPISSGFLSASPEWLESLDPLWVSWGYEKDPALGPHENDELGSTPATRRLEFAGTVDPSPYLAVAAAIDFHNEIGSAAIWARQSELNQRVREIVYEVADWEIQTPPVGEMAGGMVAYRLPYCGPIDPLRQFLWERFRLEVNFIDREGQDLMIRFSTHFYNTTAEVDVLRDAVPALQKFLLTNGGRV